MSKKNAFRIYVFVSVVIVLTCLSINIYFAQTGGKVNELNREFTKSTLLTGRAEKLLHKVNEVIRFSDFLGLFHINTGYLSLEKITRKLYYREETEVLYQKTYEALGRLGRFDHRAKKLLLSEFKPSEDPVRAMDVLVGIKLTGDKIALSQLIKVINYYMSETEIYSRLSDYR